jgi:TatD DNase family protein
MLIDTHCHLDAAEFDADRDEVHAAALAVGVERIIVPNVTVGTLKMAKTTVERYAGCLAAYGIHPLYVMQAPDGDLAVLRQWLGREKAVAVGEIGMDFYVTDVDPVREFDLPVILHVRRAVDAVLKQLRRFRLRGGIAHAFNGSRQQADEFIKLGFVLGFGGAMTFSGSTRIRELARSLPAESIVLETDAPDIPPAWLNGGRNSPAELPRIADILAELRGISRPEVIAMTGANARRAIPGI